MTSLAVVKPSTMNCNLLKKLKGGPQIFQSARSPPLSHSLPTSPAASVKIEDLAMPDGIPFEQLFTILRRRRGTLFLFALIGAVAAGTIGVWMPPRYTAKTLLVVQFPSTIPNSPSTANDDAVV